MTTLLAMASSLLIVASDATNAKPEWRSVIDALAAKHAGEATVEIATVDSVTNSLAAIRKVRPRYLAFVMRGEELDEPTVRALHKIVREIDDDPFDDAIWGIVTGPTARDAKRVASSREPSKFTSALGTTGFDLDIVPGPATMLSDANPPGVWREKKVEKVEGVEKVEEVREKESGEGGGSTGKVVEHKEAGDMSHAFAFGWNDDPELIVTSSHATERNLEMPFSRGNLVPKDGRFAVTCGLPLSEPKREKVWIAAGNCLIANNKFSPTNMLMTAIGWGKVNQFFGYTVETWFGEIGWNTWAYFNAYRMPLSMSWYAANQNLMRTLAATKPGTKERRGKEWDMDGTAFYGDPMQAVALPPLGKLPKWSSGALPLLVIDPKERKNLPKDWEVFEADDFVLVEKWSSGEVEECRREVEECRREAARWGAVSDEMVREWIAPDWVIDEEHDDWRPLFKEKFGPVVKDCKTRTEAVQKINAVIWDMLDVHYSTGRDKANQSPFHSMRIHKASCTGMSIIQVCAYRAVGIPARLVGCNWTTLKGNHSWPEFWDNGWHHFGDGNPSPIDSSWVGPFAAEADASRPETRIYASRATPNAQRTRFWRTWAHPGGPSEVWADDVTETYRRFKKVATSVQDVPTNTNYQVR